MVPPPDLLISEFSQWRELELRVEAFEYATDRYVVSYQILIDGLVEVIHQEHSIHASFFRLDEFDEGCVCGDGLVHRVGDDPHVSLALVDHLPDAFEELIAWVHGELLP